MTTSQPTVPRPVTPLGIIADNLERLRQSAHLLRAGDPDAEALLARTSALASGLEAYLERMTTPASPLLDALAADTARREWPALHRAGATTLELEREMLSGHIEGRFLNLLVKAVRAERILEIGMFTGYSALAMAQALPSDGTLVACEIDAYAADVARSWFDRSPHGTKIRIEIGPALATLDRLREANASFDLVFIDADKSGYVAYLDRLVDSSLLAPNGLICVDNTLMQGEPYLGASTPNGRAIAAFNERVVNDARLETVVLPLRDGLSLIRRAEPT